MGHTTSCKCSCECCNNRNSKNRAAKKRKISAKDAARLVAYARRDGANDVELLKYLFFAFGLGNAPETIAKTFLVLTTGIAIGAMIGILKGLKYFMKGAKLILDSDLSMIPSSIMDFIIKYILRVEKSNLPTYGAFLLWYGALEATFSGLILFLTAIADNYVYAQFFQKIATHNLESPLKLKFTPPAIDFGLWEPSPEDIEARSKAQELIDITNALTGENITLHDYVK